MKSKIWPPRLQKQPLDLKDLGSSSVNFSKSTFFKSGKRTDKTKLQVSLLVKLLRLPVFKCIPIAGPLGQTRSAITNLFTPFYKKQREIICIFIGTCPPVSTFTYTANVYRDLQGLYRETRVRGFQIYGDCMYTPNPCNFEISTLLFPL